MMELFSKPHQLYTTQYWIDLFSILIRLFAEATRSEIVRLIGTCTALYSISYCCLNLFLSLQRISIISKRVLDYYTISYI